MNEVKNAKDTFNSRINQAEERICELENTSFHIIQSEENKEIRIKKSEKIHKLWDIIKRNNICIMGGEVERDRNFKEKMAENFSNLGRVMSIQVQEAQRSSNRIQLKEIFTEMHYNQALKNQCKVRILKAAKVKRSITYK